MVKIGAKFKAVYYDARLYDIAASGFLCYAQFWEKTPKPDLVQN